MLQHLLQSGHTHISHNKLATLTNGVCFTRYDNQTASVRAASVRAASVREASLGLHTSNNGLAIDCVLQVKMVPCDLVRVMAAAAEATAAASLLALSTPPGPPELVGVSMTGEGEALMPEGCWEVPWG